MTKDEARHLAEVLNAFINEKEIQMRLHGEKRWITAKAAEGQMHFDMYAFQYRIKPEPKEFWLDPLTKKFVLAEEAGRSSMGPKAIKAREVIDE